MKTQTNITNKIRSGIAAGLIGLTALVAPMNARAEDNAVVSQPAKKPLINSPYLNAGLYSKYVGSRGFTTSETPAMQTDAGFNIGNVAYDIWVNYDIKTRSVNEVDNCLNVPYSGKNWRADLTAIHFTSPTKDFKDALEVGVTLSATKLPVNASVYAGQIIGSRIAQGQIYNATVGMSFKLDEKGNATLNLNGKLWYNDAYWVQGRGFTHASASASLDVKVGKNLTLTPGVRFQKAIEGRNGTFKDQVIWSIAATKTF